MATPVDIQIWRGDNAPAVIWQFPADFTLGGSTFDLTVFHGSTLLLARSTEDGGIDLDDNAHRLTWTPSREETLLVPVGRTAQYKLRRVLLESRETLAYGTVIGLGGNPLDV